MRWCTDWTCIWSPIIVESFLVQFYLPNWRMDELVYSGIFSDISSVRGEEREEERGEPYKPQWFCALLQHDNFLISTRIVAKVEFLLRTSWLPLVEVASSRNLSTRLLSFRRSRLRSPLEFDKPAVGRLHVFWYSSELRETLTAAYLGNFCKHCFINKLVFFCSAPFGNGLLWEAK